MNQEMAKKLRQQKQIPENIDREIHAADILKGNKLDKPSARAPASQLRSRKKSLEEQIIDHQSKLLENQAKEAHDRDEVLASQTEYIELLKECIELKEERIKELEVFAAHLSREVDGYENSNETMVALLEKRIEEVDQENAHLSAMNGNLSEVHENQSRLIEILEKEVGNLERQIADLKKRDGKCQGETCTAEKGKSGKAGFLKRLMHW